MQTLARRIHKQLARKLAYGISDENLQASSQFLKKQKRDSTETQQYASECRRNSQEWQLGAFIAVTYFLLFHRQEFLFCPSAQPTEPTEL